MSWFTPPALCYVFGGTLLAIGVFLSAFYLARLYRSLKLEDADAALLRIENLEGWGGGSLFIAGGIVIIALQWPAGAILCIPAAIVHLLLYFPVAWAVGVRAERIKKGRIDDEAENSPDKSV